MKKIITYISGVVVVLLGNIWAYAGSSEILLEGFEDNIDNVIPATDDGSRGANGNIKLTHFIRTDAEEICIKILYRSPVSSSKYLSPRVQIHIKNEI